MTASVVACGRRLGARARLEALAARSRRAPKAFFSAARQAADVVVEAGDLHLARARVDARGDRARRARHRVARRAARRARVHVLRARLQRHGETHEPAQAVRDRRAARRRSRSCRRQRRSRSERRPPRGASPAIAAARPRSKFGLPISSSSSQRNWMLTRASGLEREARAVERRERRPLVVGRAAAEPAHGLRRSRVNVNGGVRHSGPSAGCTSRWL